MLTIAWDVDDVLNELMRCWFEAWEGSEKGGSGLNFGDIRKNPPHRILGIEKGEYLRSLDTFRLSDAYLDMAPREEVLQWFKRHGTGFRHIALTAVPRLAVFQSAFWVMKHFGDWFRSFHFVPSPRASDIPGRFESTKADYLKWFGKADIFIDDSEDHIRDVKALGIRCFLVSRPWNSGGMNMGQILQSLIDQTGG